MNIVCFQKSNEYCVLVICILQASLVSVNEYISIPGQQVWVAPTTWTPQKQQAQNSHQGEGGGMQMVKEKISNSMSANLVQRSVKRQTCVVGSEQTVFVVYVSGMMCVCASSDYLPHATCTGTFCEYCGWTSVVYSCLPLPLLMSQIHIYAEYCGGFNLWSL